MKKNLLLLTIIILLSCDNIYQDLIDNVNANAKISCGYFGSLLLKKNSDLWVAGRNVEGKLGVGDNENGQLGIGDHYDRKKFRLMSK